MGSDLPNSEKRTSMKRKTLENYGCVSPMAAKVGGASLEVFESCGAATLSALSQYIEDEWL